MTPLLSLLLGTCVLAILHTYVFYPRWIVERARSQVRGKSVETPAAADWPPVFVLMAAHNEEAVLEEKLATLAAQDYPGPLKFFVGSDNSTDRTNAILTDFAERDERLHPTYFRSRQGKPGIINQLAGAAGPDGIYLMTDASVMLRRPNVITELVRPLRDDPRLGIVDATMVQTGAQNSGIGGVETEYINREVAVKRAEGKLWGAMIGPFGGCFALRAAAYRPVPDNFLVDDFFLCLSAYEQGYRGISSAAAVVEETVGQELDDEFRRKVRISSGNWQNLRHFRHLCWPPYRSPLHFAFFSHKVLRWLTPFLLLVGGLAWLALALITGNHWVGISFALVSGLLVTITVADPLLAQFGIHLNPLRRLRYFLAMNLALLVGFYRYLTGIRSNVWQPSKRN